MSATRASGSDNMALSAALSPASTYLTAISVSGSPSGLASTCPVVYPASCLVGFLQPAPAAFDAGIPPPHGVRRSRYASLTCCPRNRKQAMSSNGTSQADPDHEALVAPGRGREQFQPATGLLDDLATDVQTKAKATAALPSAETA